MIYFLVLLFCIVVLSIKVNACRDLIFDMYTLLSKRMAHLENVIQLAQSEVVGREVVKGPSDTKLKPTSDMSSQHLYEESVKAASVPPSVVADGPIIADVVGDIKADIATDIAADIAADASGPADGPGPIAESSATPSGLPINLVQNFIREVEKKKKRSTKKQELK